MADAKECDKCGVLYKKADTETYTGFCNLANKKIEAYVVIELRNNWSNAHERYADLCPTCLHEVLTKLAECNKPLSSQMGGQ